MTRGSARRLPAHAIAAMELLTDSVIENISYRSADTCLTGYSRSPELISLHVEERSIGAMAAGSLVRKCWQDTYEVLDSPDEN